MQYTTFYFSHIAGSGGLLPTVLCGDFNSTPNSPLVDFITSSFLNYSNMSATEIAGYDYKKGHSRVIPSPLLPPSMNIGPNCMYTEPESDLTDAAASSNGAEITQGTTRDDALPEKEVGKHFTGDVSDQETGSAVTGASVGDFIRSQNENFKGSSSDSHRLRGGKARSARGAKARGMSYSGVKISDFATLTSGTSSSKVSVSPPPSESQSVSSSGVQTPEDTKAPNSPTEHEANASNFTEEDTYMEWEREKTRENQKSALNTNSSAKGKVEPPPSSGTAASQATTVGQLCRSEPRKRPHCYVHGLITHPFKFVTAYPQSRMSTPSTVTTFHQSAFETVDYIFFTPPTNKRAGFHLLSRKALPSTHVLLDLGPQPHRYLSSDHLLLQVCFQLVSCKGSQNN